MYNKTNEQYDQLEKMEVFYKEMENNHFEDDFERRRDIAGVEGQIDYWESDKTLRSVLSEQQELLVAEKQGQEELLNSMCVELKRLRNRMNKEKRAFKKNATIKIEPYLAEYIIGKYGVDKKSGTVKIPHTSDL